MTYQQKDPHKFVLIAIVTLFLISLLCGQLKAQIDVNEYVPGHPTYTTSPSAPDQLKAFPVPRYKPGHTMLPNFSWMDEQWFGARWQSGVSDAQAVTNSVEIQTERSKNFNYYVNVSWSGDNFNTAWKNLANSNPSWKVGIITLRPQTKGYSGSSGFWCGCLSNDNYLQDSQGRFLDWNGNVTSVKSVRPTAPVSNFVNDGINARGYIQAALVGLTNTVDLVSENGEVYPFIEVAGMIKDPVVVSAKNASGLDYENYLAKRWREHDNSYRDQFMSSSFLSGAKYQEYRLDGHRDYQFRWEQTKYFNTPINGKYYATGDFYVRYPYNWKDWISAWHGLRWVTESRHYEILSGDNLYSPFIGAGWDRNEELNVRPAQWLGLLKLNIIYGAEFFYVGFFNENFSQTNPPPNPKGYAWQAVIPSYVQAIGSYAEDILRNGQLMAGDMIDNQHNPPIPFYQFSAGASNKVVAIRKLGNKYLITGTIQNSSNVINSTPIYSTATINLNGEQLTINIRRHGSTYIYDPSTKTFYQLDGWHQYQHPWYWTKDVEIEAELGSAITLKTFNSAAPNYTNFKTVVTLGNNEISSYTIHPRESGTKYLFVKGNGSIEASLGSTKEIMNLNGWQRMNLGNVSNTSQTLMLKGLVAYSEIDSISVTSNQNKYPITQTCTASAVISASNPAPCTGDSVMLSANTNVSYQWSDGQTTQSIIVRNNGTYTVTVNNGTCTATSQPYTVAFVQCSNCPAATNLNAPFPTDKNFYLYWNSVAQADSGYTVFVRDLTTSTDLTPLPKPQWANPVLQKFVGKLKPERQYEVYIICHCKDSDSEKSAKIQVTTQSNERP